MRLLIAALFLFCTSAFANLNTPPAGAVCASEQGTTVYGYDVCVWPTYGPGGNEEYGLKAAYFANGEWVWLAEKTHWVTNFTDEASTDQYFSTFVDGINQAIEQTLKPIGGTEPANGMARIQWLAGQLVFSGNAVSL